VDIRKPIKFPRFDIRPGTIWLLPVNYFLNFPPSLLCYDERNKEYFVEEDNGYWCNNGKYNSNLGETNVIVKAQVRPFLVIQKPDALKKIDELGAQGWHYNAIAGFPVSSYSNIVEHSTSNANFHIDPVRLKEKNDYDFYHYLPSDSITCLKNESYVTMTTITRLHISYFTHLSGAAEQNDYNGIAEKFRKIFL